MCGILMTISREENPAFRSALELMKHRGPNAQKFQVHDTKSGVLSLGHVRLSIHDLDQRSEQPFISKCENYILIFNGEIYNFEELKNQLLPNEQFVTTSDTEVLLLLLIKYGDKILNDLDGMFSFCFYNKVENSIILVRDQLGIKPIYYSFSSSELIVASEIKPILLLLPTKPEISQSAMYEFMRNSFIYEPETGFKGVWKIPSGHFCTIDLNNLSKPVPRQYWDPIDTSLNQQYSMNPSTCYNLESSVEESIKLQQKSDVPVGLFFSGGVDSTILLSRLSSSKKVDILSVKHDSEDIKESGNTNDYYYACKISKLLRKQIKPIEFSPILDGEAFLMEVKNTAIGVEELVADFTYSVSKKLSENASEQNSVVMLSGMGADEIFAGYEKYKLLKYPNLYRIALFMTKPFLRNNKKFAKKFERLLAYYDSSNFYQSYTNLLGYFTGMQVRAMFNNVEQLENDYQDKLARFAPESLSNLNKSRLLDLRGFLQHNFTVGDKSSMAASIELRVPLATKKLMEISFSTKESDLISLFSTKISLRKLLVGLVPRKFLERKKAGFHPPMDSVINSIGYERLISLWENNCVHDLIDRTTCEKLLEEHFNKNKNNTYQIFQITFLSFWYNHFIVENNYARC